MIESGDLEILLDSSDPEERRRATSELYVRASDAPLGTCSLVLKAMADEDWRVRKEAIATAFALAPSQELLSELIHALAPGENVGLRNAAVEALGGFGMHAVTALDAALPELDADGRKLAVEALGRVGHEAALPILVRASSDVDPNVRIAAVEATADLGRAGVLEAVKVLATQLASDEPMLALAALNGLNALGAAVPFATVSRLLAQPLLRRAALLAAGRTRDPGAIEPVLTALERASGTAFVEVVCAMAELAREPKLLRVIREKGSRLSGRAGQKLLTLAGDEAAFDDARRAAMIATAVLAVEGAAERAVEALGDDRFLAEAHEMFELLGESAIPTLVRAVRARVPEQASCLSLLGRLASPAQVGLVLEAALGSVDDETPDVQREALGIIGRFGGGEQLEALSRSLPEDVSAPTRKAHEAALQALAVRYPNQARALIRAADPTGPSAHAACLVIAGLGASDSSAAERQFLVSTLGNTLPSARRTAIEALSEVAVEGALEALAFAVTDEENDVRDVAVAALGRLRDGSKRAIGFERLAEIVEHTSDLDLRARALRALGATEDERAVSVILPFLRSVSPLVAVVAIEALSQLGGAIDALLTALGHGEPEVVKAGMFALSELEDPRVAVALGMCLDHEAWDVRSLAAELLTRLPGETSMGLLRARAVIESSTAVREAIARAIERMSGVRRTPPPILGGSLPPR